MAYYFFDTSALKHRYIRTPQRAVIGRIVSDKRNACYICDVTILEMAHALGSVCRTTQARLRNYDAMDSRFFDDIATGRIQVRATSPLGVLRARNLLRFGGVIIGADLGSADALVASTCLDLAHDLRVRIRFYTADWGQYRLMRKCGVFRSAMVLQYILQPKHDIPARTG